MAVALGEAAEAPRRGIWRAVSFLLNFRVAIVIVTIFVATNLFLATLSFDDQTSIHRYVGWDQSTLEAGRYWRQLPGTLMQGYADMKWHQPVIMLFFLCLLEYQAGHLAALVTFFLSDWLTAPLVTLALWGLSALHFGDATVILHDPSSGASAASIGCGIAAALLLPGRLKWIAPAIILTAVILTATLQRMDAALAHPAAIFAGAALSLVWWRHLPGRRCLVPASFGRSGGVLGWLMGTQELQKPTIGTL